MGMPITVEIADPSASAAALDRVFSYFEYVDEKFSTYKPASEISRFNRGEIAAREACEDFRAVLKLAEQTKRESNGFFDVYKDSVCDPAGLVKGWAIRNAADLLRDEGYKNFFVEAGGDIQTAGQNAAGQSWSVGIQNPFNLAEVVKVLNLSGEGIATSGNYRRGRHIYNPRAGNAPADEIASITVIGPDVYEADRFATAAFAMGRAGIGFIENRPGLEGYSIDKEGVATMTSGLERHLDKRGADGYL